jgi:hypothetical protein
MSLGYWVPDRRWVRVEPELVEHYRYWTPARNRAEQVAAGIRVTLRRIIRRKLPGCSFPLHLMDHAQLVAVINFIDGRIKHVPLPPYDDLPDAPGMALVAARIEAEPLEGAA